MIDASRSSTSAAWTTNCVSAYTEILYDRLYDYFVAPSSILHQTISGGITLSLGRKPLLPSLPFATLPPSRTPKIGNHLESTFSFTHRFHIR